MSAKKTRKEHERKRQEKLKARTDISAFRHQIEYKIRQRFPELGEDHPAVAAEMDATIVKLPNVVVEFRKVVKNPEFQHLLEQ